MHLLEGLLFRPDAACCTAARLRMPGVFRSLALWAGWVLWGAIAPAAEWRLPPIQGDLTGDITPLKLPGAPTLHWTIDLKSGSPNERVADLAIDGRATHLKTSFRLDPA